MRLKERKPPFQDRDVFDDAGIVLLKEKRVFFLLHQTTTLNLADLLLLSPNIVPLFPFLLLAGGLFGGRLPFGKRILEVADELLLVLGILQRHDGSESVDNVLGLAEVDVVERGPDLVLHFLHHGADVGDMRR